MLCRHAKLGEPITEDEAREAVHIVGSGTGSISFEDLARYWDGTHPALAKGYVEDGVRPEALNIERERRRTWYRARFKFVRAKIPNAAVGRVSTEAEGPCPSLEYRLRFFYNDPHAGKVPISPWHDVPLRNGDGTFNMIVEIPKWTRKKFEIATGEVSLSTRRWPQRGPNKVPNLPTPYSPSIQLFNPIKQDVKNGCLREYQWGDQLFNYGALPQTWEDPKVILGESGTPGDNDPIDIVELGAKMWGVGSIVRVKILGVIGLIDAGETDWKLIGISAEDPMAHLLDDLDDVNIHMPGAIDALRTWLQLYKLPVVNSFVFNGAARDREFALSVVEETHQHWLALVNGAGPGLGEKGAPCISAAGLRRSSSLTALSSLLGTPALE